MRPTINQANSHFVGAAVLITVDGPFTCGAVAEYTRTEEAHIASGSALAGILIGGSVSSNVMAIHVLSYKCLDIIKV